MEMHASDGDWNKTALGAVGGAALGFLASGINVSVIGEGTQAYGQKALRIGYNLPKNSLPKIGFGKAIGNATSALVDAELALTQTFAAMQGLPMAYNTIIGQIGVPNRVSAPNLPQPTGRSYLVFHGAQVPDRFRLDGLLGWVDVLSDGSSQIRDVFSSNSGSNLLAAPEGDYVVDNYRLRNAARDPGMVRDGVGFSVDVGPDGFWGRSQLRIHPDGREFIGTAGCVGLTCPVSQLNDFSNRIRTYLGQHGSMRLRIMNSDYIGMGEINISATPIH